MPKSVRHILIGLLFILWMTTPATTIAGAGRTISFSQALNLAKAQHINVILGREKVKQSIERLHESRAALLPQINGTASQLRETKNLEAQGLTLPGVPPLIGPFNSFDARVKVMQNIFDAQAFAAYRSFEAGRDVAAADEKRIEQESIALVASLYINALRAGQHVKLAQALLARDEEEQKLSRTHLELGTGTSLSTLQTQAQIEESRHRLMDFKDAAAQANRDLATTLGLEPDTQLRLSEFKDNIPTPLPSDIEVEKNVETHPQVVVAKKSLRQSELDKKVQVADFLPKIKAGADYGASGTLANNTKATYTYGAEMDWPLFEGGLRLGRVRESASAVRQRKASLKNTERTIEAGILHARDGVLTARSALTAAKANYGQAIQVWSIAKNRFDSGLGSHFDLTNAAATLALSRDGLEEAAATERLARLNLIYSSGKIDTFMEALEKKR